MSFPKDFLYTKDHEWAQLSDNIVTIGITEHAQNSLGDIVYLELPEVDTNLNKGETFGLVESVKAASDLYSPITGRVIEVNKPLIEEPSELNHNPHSNGWLIKVEINNEAELNDLLTVADYEKLVNELA